jgi:hypothetical protein
MLARVLHLPLHGNINKIQAENTFEKFSKSFFHFFFQTTPQMAIGLAARPAPISQESQDPPGIVIKRRPIKGMGL